MTGNAINAKSEALELHELSSEELDAVSGGDGMDISGAASAAAAQKNQNALNAAQQEAENKAAMQATMTFQRL
jgi:hypothetical protein